MRQIKPCLSTLDDLNPVWGPFLCGCLFEISHCRTRLALAFLAVSDQKNFPSKSFSCRQYKNTQLAGILGLGPLVAFLRAAASCCPGSRFSGMPSLSWKIVFRDRNMIFPVPRTSLISKSQNTSVRHAKRMAFLPYHLHLPRFYFYLFIY